MKGDGFMASVNWMKIKTSNEAKKIFAHCSTDKRLEHNHSNKEIDKSKTSNNLLFGEFKNGYDAVCKLYDEIISELDSKEGANKRKDRVTAIAWEMVCPEGLNSNETKEWFEKVYNLFTEKYNNILGGTVHLDEVHEYIDSETGQKKMSRPHIHIYGIPVVDGKLNAKKLMTRENITNSHKMVDTFTKENYPHATFLTGKKRKTKKTVEELKNETAIKEAEALANEIIKNARLKSNEIILQSEEMAKNYRNFEEKQLNDTIGIVEGIKSKNEVKFSKYEVVQNYLSNIYITTSSGDRMTVLEKVEILMKDYDAQLEKDKKELETRKQNVTNTRKLSDSTYEERIKQAQRLYENVMRDDSDITLDITNRDREMF